MGLSGVPGSAWEGAGEGRRTGVQLDQDDEGRGLGP